MTKDVAVDCLQVDSGRRNSGNTGGRAHGGGVREQGNGSSVGCPGAMLCVCVRARVRACVRTCVGARDRAYVCVRARVRKVLWPL